MFFIVSKNLRSCMINIWYVCLYIYYVIFRLILSTLQNTTILIQKKINHCLKPKFVHFHWVLKFLSHLRKFQQLSDLSNKRFWSANIFIGLLMDSIFYSNVNFTGLINNKVKSGFWFHSLVTNTNTRPPQSLLGQKIRKAKILDLFR